MIDEHRKFIRFNCLLSGKARLQNRSIENAEVKNFSRKGMLLNLPDSNSSIGGGVEVRLYIPGRMLPVYISGKIVWNQNVNNHCEVGVKIDQADRNHKSEIMDYVYSVWQRRKQNEKNGPIRLERNH
jgi:hypothetical protein